MVKHTIPVLVDPAVDAYILSKEAVANVNLVRIRLNDATAGLDLNDRIILAGMLESALMFAIPMRDRVAGAGVAE